MIKNKEEILREKTEQINKQIKIYIAIVNGKCFNDGVYYEIYNCLQNK